MLDQPKSQWEHPTSFYLTVRLLKSLKAKIKFLDVTHKDSIDFFENLVKKNKSFCIFPFIEMLTNFDATTVCCRSATPIVKLSELKDFKNDPNYVAIRQKMIAGELLPEHCNSCYRLENKGILSARQQETVEWANILNINSLEDLDKIVAPAYYEVRPDNKCNLQCRTCNPLNSHLIAREYKKLNIEVVDLLLKKHTSGFEIIKFDNLKKLYVAGGEPMIMPAFYQFLDDCINNANTDFEMLVNTNGTKLSTRFKNQLKNFSNFQFIFSVDGFQELNYYVRWPADWNTIVENIQYLRDHGHRVTINTTVSIYNISSLDKLFAFIDCKFPNTLVHCQLAEGPKWMSPFVYPFKDQALESLLQVQKLMCYSNDPLLASSIDGYIDQFENHYQIDFASLAHFYNINDKLDQSRDIQLKDYLPELDNYRKIVYNNI
jgi:pyruvate-formate lyase-activating enzyme